MKHFKPLGGSFLIAWVTAWIVTTMFLAGSSATDPVNMMLLMAVYSTFTLIGTFLVVGATWLIVATPYYYCCMRRHDFPLAHHLAGAGFAIAASGLITWGDPKLWPYMATIAVLTSIAGIHTLQRSATRKAQ